MKKAVIYCRFSPRKNEELCQSIETQLDQCREYCAERRYEVVAAFEDRALSGGEEDRPGLWQAVDALKRGFVLVVYKHDRLARDVYLSELIHRNIAKRKASVEAVTGGSYGDSPEQQLIRQILQVFAEYERKVTAARTRTAMLHHQARGQRMSHKTPYGWQPDPANPKRLIADQIEQQHIEAIATLNQRGHSFREIARQMNRQSDCRGHTWHHQAIINILNRASTA